jgi:hypothetical protein
MWIQTSPLAAFLWSLLSILLYTSLWIYLHSLKKSVRVSELEVMSRRETALIGSFLLLWLGIQVALFSDRDLGTGKSLAYWLGLTLELRAVLSTLTAFTMTILLFSGSFLQAAVSEDMQGLFGAINYTGALGRAAAGEILLRMSGVGLMSASDVGELWVTLVGTMGSGLCSLHLCYFYSRVRRNRHQVLSEHICQLFIEETLSGLISTRLFLLTGSIYPCFLVHFLISALRFPDGLYLHPNHPAHRHRRLLTSAYILGVAGFFALHVLLVDASAYDSPFY